ncbi:MAG: hypothetical protein IKL50_00485 [Bacteroidales bacterium]|nr:hypothetical protein [Bacteroidales bacterium]
MIEVFVILLFAVGGIIFLKLLRRSSDEQEYKEMERAIHEAKKQQEIKAEEKVLIENAYKEISDIWNFEDKTILAILHIDEDAYSIHHIKLDYKPNESDETPWSISLIHPDGRIRIFKAKRSGNSIVGFDNDKIVVMKNSILKVGDLDFYFDPEQDEVKHANSLIDLLVSEVKIETFRLEHLKDITDEDVLNALPKFTFTISDKGIMCNEINYPQMQVEEFFEKNNGGEYIFQNKVYYIVYCKNGDLEIFRPEEEEQFAYFMNQIKLFAKETGCGECNTNFNISGWYTAIISGINDLFLSIKTYVANKTLDVTPDIIKGNDIVFTHKRYSHLYSDKDDSNLTKRLAVTMMERERIDNNILYQVSIKDKNIIIKIGDDSFVSTSIIETIK